MFFDGAKRFFSEFIGNYINIPKLAWFIIPLILLDTFTTSICLNISLYVEKLYGLKEFAVGEVISSYYVGAFLGSMAGGALSVKYSTAIISSVGFLLLSIMFYIIGHNGTPSTLSLSMAVIGLVGNVVSISNVASFIKTANQNTVTRMRLINLELVLFNMSFSLGAAFLIELNKLELVYAMKIISMVFIVCSLYLWNIRNKDMFLPAQSKNREPLCAPKSISKFFLLLSSVFFVGLIFSMIKVVYTPTIAHRFGDNSLAVLVASVNPWVIIFVQPYLVNKIRNKENAILMGFGGLIIGAGYFLFGISSSFVAAVVILAVLTLGEILYSPLSKGIAMSCFDKRREGFAIGVWRSVFMGAGFLGPLLSGWVAQKYSDALVWDFCLALGILCFVTSIILNNFKLNVIVEKELLN